MELDGAVVMVTGASSGIGAATVAAVGAAGARVVLLARSEDRIAEVAAGLPDALALRCDVTVQDDVDAAVRSTLERFGRVDVLVNNAGQSLTSSVEDTELEHLRALVELNLVAPLRFMQAVLPTMREQGAGSIVNVSSGTTLSAIPSTGAYSATKAALEQLSAVARVECVDSGIAVSTVLPSLTRTNLIDNSIGAVPGGYDMSRAQAPEQVADAILYLIRSGDASIDLVPAEWGGSYRS